MSLPAAFASALAGLAAAMGLIFRPGIGNKKAPAVRAAAFWVHGFPPAENHSHSELDLKQK
jgi:hypothetical protein